MANSQQGSVQAGGFKSSGDGSTPTDGGQGTFSMPIVPEGSATAKQSKAKSPGAGQPAQGGEKTVFEGGALENEDEGAAGGGDKTPSKSDQNKDGKSQRNSQAGWQQITETLGKINERLDKFEQGKAPDPKAEKEGEGEKGKEAKQENEAMQQLSETLAATNARLERMEFEGEADNADLRSPDLAEIWKKVNNDPKFKDFSLPDRADYVRGKAQKSSGNAMKDQLSRAESSMPRGAGGSGKSASGGNPNVTEEDVAVGKAFGISREELERELS